jgi:NADP-dependent 3-hydroxy acid dehydrogenase YdfG
MDMDATKRLTGKVAWVTGAGTGIGEAAALALAEGAIVVLTGRRAEPLERLAQRIHQAGGTAHARPGDLTDAATPQAIGADIVKTLGRIDILVNNAGVNIRDRHWDKLTPHGIDQVVHGNLSAALYCVTVVLPVMRAQQDGVIIHTASMAGRFIGGLSGPIYTAAKHGVVAMSHTINMEECDNGIRSTAMLPGEVATPILDQRPIPVTPEQRARLVQPEDCGDLVRYIACLPAHVCINEVMITPAYNRGYIAARTRV